MSAELAKRDELAVADERDYVKAVARDIGKELAAYIEVMYPDAVKATSSTFLLSVRNHTYNEIMGWLETRQDTAKRLEWREAFRRQWVRTYRKIRRQV